MEKDAWTVKKGKKIYQQRAATSETVNADLRTYRGLTPFTVRGLNKIKCVALWCALAYNLTHFSKALAQLKPELHRNSRAKPGKTSSTAIPMPSLTRRPPLCHPDRKKCLNLFAAKNSSVTGSEPPNPRNPKQCA